MSAKLYKALADLDPENDDHWTDEGLPRLDVLSDFVGQPVTRVQVKEATKNFTRAHPTLEDNYKEIRGIQENLDEESEEKEFSPKSLEKAKDKLGKVRDKLNDAQRDFMAAQREVDAEILRFEVHNMGSRPAADNVRRYQQSQAEQRNSSADLANKIAGLIAANTKADSTGKDQEQVRINTSTDKQTKNPEPPAGGQVDQTVKEKDKTVKV